MSFTTVAVSTLHNAPPAQFSGENRRNSKWVRLAWDAFTFEEYYRAAGWEPNERITDRAFEHIFHDATGPVNQAVFIGDKEDARQGSMYVIHFKDADDATGYLLQWIKDIQTDNYWASGDDSHYDYAPDEAMLIYQIARHFNLEEIYSLFYIWAKVKWYDGGGEDDELLPVWTVAP